MRKNDESSPAMVIVDNLLSDVSYLNAFPNQKSSSSKRASQRVDYSTYSPIDEEDEDVEKMAFQQNVMFGERKIDVVGRTRIQASGEIHPNVSGKYRRLVR